MFPLSCAGAQLCTAGTISTHRKSATTYELLLFIICILSYVELECLKMNFHVVMLQLLRSTDIHTLNEDGELWLAYEGLKETNR